ncbi:MAG: hypothetical protein ACPGOT_04625 [Candidatus Poseidoniaceae archaeon]
MEKMLPATVDNTYSGNVFAFYVFIMLTVMTTFRSLAHILLPDGGAESIATIDVRVEGGDTIIAMFAYWGLSQLLLAVLYILTIVRYKSLIPLMYLTMVVEYTLRFVIGLAKPIEHSGTAPGEVANVLLPLFTLIMLLLSLQEKSAHS